MDRQVTADEFEDVLVRMCAPTLLGAKPANMFTFTGCYADVAPQLRACEDRQVVRGVCPGEQDAVCEGLRACSTSEPLNAGLFHDTCSCGPCPCSTPQQRRDELQAVAQRFDRELRPFDMRVQVIAWRAFGAIVLVYRPQQLGAHLGDPRIAAALARRGYPVENGSLEDLLAHLMQRFAQEKLPHEIGFFLGYPYEDVAGFVQHQGRNFRYSGCWKVYGDPRPAIKRFARYRRCTRRCARLRRAGVTVTDIAADQQRFHAERTR